MIMIWDEPLKLCADVVEVVDENECIEFYQPTLYGIKKFNRLLNRS